MTLPPPSVCRRIRKLHAQMGSSGKDGEVARNKLNVLLAEHRLTWNDLPAILYETDDARREGGDAEPPAAAPPTDRAESDILGVLLAVIEEYIAVTPEERMAIALWTLHAHVFDIDHRHDGGRCSPKPRPAASPPPSRSCVHLRVRLPSAIWQSAG